MTHRDFRQYLLSNVFRSPDDGAGAPAPAPVGDSAADASKSAAAAAAPGAAAAPSGDGAAKAAPDAPVAPADGAAAEGAAAGDAKPESTPSLLEAANAKPPAKEGDKPAEAAAPKDDAAAAKPADGAKPATEAKPDKDAKAAADKPADAKADKKDEAAAPAKEALAVPQPQARSYEAFKVPEGAKLDDKQVKSFTDVLEAADLGHQDRAQKLVDMHVAEVQRVVQEQVTHQRKVWDDYNNQLKSELKADAELGGNRADTVLGYAKAVVEQFGGTEEQVTDTLKMMTHTGMGNYIGMARLLSNIYEKLVAAKVVPGNPPSRGGSRKSFQDVAYGEPGASSAAS